MDLRRHCMKKRYYWGSNIHSTANKKLVKESLPVLMKTLLGKHLPITCGIFSGGRGLTSSMDYVVDTWLTEGRGYYTSHWCTSELLVSMWVEHCVNSHLLSHAWLSSYKDFHFTIIKEDTCTPMFTAALFTIARTWKQPKCPQTDEWIKKLWYINTMEYYSVIKRNSCESVLVRWMLYQVKSDKQISYQCIYMESRKMILMNLFAGQE